MSDAWLDFATMILIQSLLFIAFALSQKRFSEVPRILAQGFLIGIPFGLGFDLILGKYLGLSSYVLGFNAFFLIPNAILSYGLFAANILLLKRMRCQYFLTWTLFITAVYEIANLFFPVWDWKINLPPIPFLIVLSIGYVGGAILVIKVSKGLFKA
jgi:hypothetical protein